MKIWPDIFIKLVLLICSGLITTTGCAQEPDLRQALGTAVDILQHHTHAEKAHLKVVGVPESRQQVFKKADRIAGYPITGKLVSLDKNISQQLTTLLLDKSNYADIRQRCQNQYFHGIRFSKGKEIIEIAIGVSCNQVLAAFRDGKETKWWGGVLGNEFAKQVLTLLRELPAADSSQLH